MVVPSKFDDIRPYNPEEVRPAIEALLKDRQFQAILRGAAPFLPKFLRNGLVRLMLVGINDPLSFQKRFMKPVVRYVLKKCTDGCLFTMRSDLNKMGNYTFVSNHRDIVLDSAILDERLITNGFSTTCEIAIGDNLLIYPWIKTLVKLNKAFSVRRSLSPREMFQSSILMSEYIHFAVNEKHENIWIAQREGRAKDSSDNTQESVLKMLGMGSNADTHADGLKDLNIVPLTISYEYDPCDYLKAMEFQLKRDDPSWRKSKKDDLDNMKTGIMGYKGRVHYECAPCINEWLDDLKDLTNNEFYGEVAKRMDKEIHLGYQLYPGNWIAYDIVNGNRANADKYTPADEQRFSKYIDGQLAKINIPNKDDKFLREKMIIMYANPVKNKLRATGQE